MYLGLFLSFYHYVSPLMQIFLTFPFLTQGNVKLYLDLLLKNSGILQ